MSKHLVTQTYTRASVGCHANGTHGHKHVRTILGGILCRSLDGQGIARLVSRLQDGMSDDAGEEYEALALLNALCCDEHVFFEFVDGDLMLVESA